MAGDVQGGIIMLVLAGSWVGWSRRTFSILLEVCKRGSSALEIETGIGRY